MTKENKTKTVRWEGVITYIQSNILMALATYKFLTLSQLLLLHVGTTQYKYLWKQIASLRDRKTPLVKSQRFSVAHLQNGKPPQRIEDWYFLNKAGKKALQEEFGFDGQIQLPSSRTSIPYKDYQHRRNTIDFQITLRLWGTSQKVKIALFDTYFEKTANSTSAKNLQAKTRIDFSNGGYFIPDGAFSLIHPKGKKFFLMEMYQGLDVKRTIQQLHKHATAMTQRYTHKAYKLPENKSYHVVLIFLHQKLQDAVVSRLKNHGEAFQIIQKYFRCKYVEQLINDDFYTDWRTLFGEEVDLY